MKSILQDEKVCFFTGCGNPECFEHHIYFGSNRKTSEKHGFKIWLCLEHHTAGKLSPHRNKEIDLRYKRLCQSKYEETHSRQDFMDKIGRNYL